MTISLAACSQQQTNSGLDLKPDEIVITYQAVEDEEGGCRPTYEAITQKDADGLYANKIYMLRGENYYYKQQQRIGNIPLQIKMEDETISLLNEVIVCDQLTIKLVIEECKYQWDADREGCPPITIKGQEAFSGIELTYELKK